MTPTAGKMTENSGVDSSRRLRGGDKSGRIGEEVYHPYWEEDLAINFVGFFNPKWRVVLHFCAVFKRLTLL